MELRIATPSDASSLWKALYYASHSDDEDGVGLDDIRSNPTLRRYVAGWGIDTDLGVVAEVDGRFAGAAWLRLLPNTACTEPSFVDVSTPELAIAVLPEFQGQGIGTRMLEGLVESARGRFPAIVLGVRLGNDAERLYRRLGLVELERIRNRVGTESLKMLLLLE